MDFDYKLVGRFAYLKSAAMDGYGVSVASDVVKVAPFGSGVVAALLEGRGVIGGGECPWRASSREAVGRG